MSFADKPAATPAAALVAEVFICRKSWKQFGRFPVRQYPEYGTSKAMMSAGPPVWQERIVFWCSGSTSFLIGMILISGCSFWYSRCRPG